MEALIVFLVFGLPLLCLTAIILVPVYLVVRPGRGGGALNADETRVIQEIHDGLVRMEQRVEALETVLADELRQERSTVPPDLP